MISVSSFQTISVGSLFNQFRLQTHSSKTPYQDCSLFFPLLLPQLPIQAGNVAQENHVKAKGEFPDYIAHLRKERISNLHDILGVVMGEGVRKIWGPHFSCDFNRFQITQQNNFLKWNTDIEITQSKYLSQVQETFLSF